MSGWLGRRRRRLLAAGLACCASLALASSAAAAVSVGHSGWFWSNPQPQGQDLSGLDFSGARGYAAGAFGTLLRTDDGGASWAGINTGLTDALVRVRAIDANTVVVGGGCALRRSNDGGQSFTRLPWTASDQDCPSQIASFAFPSGSVGYLMTADGSVFRTTDGGETFSRQTSIPGTESAGGSRAPTDIFFTGDSTGVAITSGGGGKVFRTVDNGNSWVEVASPAAGLNGVTFVSATDGFAVGAGKTLLSTVDGGATWTPQPLTGVPGQDLRSIDCATSTLCLIVGGGGHIVRTADGGATGADIAPATGSVLAAAFSSATRAVGVGQRGLTVVSDDGGATYAPVGGSIAGTGFGRLRATSAAIANVGAANGVLARTTDGGTSWTTVGVPTTAPVRDASFPSAGAGYAIDTLGGAFKTVNGGSSWQILNIGATQAPMAVLAPSAGEVLLVGPKGVRRSTDGGGSFAAVSDKDVAQARLINVEPAGGAILAYGGSGLRTSTNGGATWKAVKLPKKEKVADASFQSAKAGFMLTKDGQVMRTRNGGRKWKDMSAIGTGTGFGISFSSPTNGYVTTSRFGDEAFGFALRTTDGGASWQPQLIAGERIADIWDTGPTGFALNATGSFYATATGGQAGTASALTLKQKGGPKAARAAKAGKVLVAGTLSPVEGGEQIVVSYRDNGRWRSRIETAATNGQFTSAFKVRRETVAVAQWLGDDTRAGAGSKVARVKPVKEEQEK